MTPERWRQVKSVFYDAAECPAADLPSFLSRRCGDDAELRAEVESLLASAVNPASVLLDSPAFPADMPCDSSRVENAGPMIGRTIGNYIVTGELAHGGMGVVYRGRHTTLPREVVIKCIRPSTGGFALREELETRFRREAHIQCQFDHPNVVRVYEFFTEADGCFLVLEYVNGPSVRALLNTRGPLPVNDVVRLAAQTLAGLEHAHTLRYTDQSGNTGAGIVHRDIKPANLLVDERGTLKLTDFGIAKAAVGRDLTKTGWSPGTLDYMSPEQIRGAAVDARSDLYSLGITLYEMLTGRVPFEGGRSVSDYDLLKAHVETDPPPIESLNPGIPPAVAGAVMRALERDPAHRWQSAAAFRDALLGGVPVPVQRKAAARVRGRRAVLMIAAAVLLAAAAAVPVLWKSRKPATPSVAVLPFDDLTPAKDQAYFCQGLAEELMHELARAPDLRVIGPTSSFQTGIDTKDILTIGKKLNVNAIVLGSVRTDNTHTRINARLIQSTDGSNLWTATYDIQLNDYLAVQEGIAIAVAGALHRTLHPRVESSSQRTSDPAALKAYLEGRQFARKRTKEDMVKAAELFNRALTIDPGNAKAWAALAEVRSNQAGLGELATDEGYRLAREAAQKALTLDPNLSDAYAALARIQLLHDWDWTGADASYQKTRALEPGGIRGISGSATLARILGHLDEAVTLSRASVEYDPLSPSVFHNAGLAFYFAGEYEEAAAAFKQSLKLVPEKTITHELLGEVYLAQGRATEALAEVEKERYPALKLSGLALAYYALHRYKESDQQLSELVRTRPDVPELIAEVYAYRGENEKAFEWLGKAYTERDPGLTQLKASPLFAGLRRDARYAALLSKMRLPK